jgi:hypothetical protein
VLDVSHARACLLNKARIIGRAEASRQEKLAKPRRAPAGFQENVIAE